MLQIIFKVCDFIYIDALGNRPRFPENRFLGSNLAGITTSQKKDAPGRCRMRERT
jgi:hypothetical protein